MADFDKKERPDLEILKGADIFIQMVSVNSNSTCFVLIIL